MLFGNCENILIVEDNIEVLSLLKEVLTTFNYNVTICDDGAAAYELYFSQNYKFDLVISDLGMPKMAGIELFEMLYKLNPDIKFIAMSGFGHNDVENLLIKLGAKAFIRKPFTIETLLQTIRDILNS